MHCLCDGLFAVPCPPGSAPPGLVPVVLILAPCRPRPGHSLPGFRMTKTVNDGVCCRSHMGRAMCGRWLVRGNLNNGVAHAGVGACGNGNNALSNANWNIAARISGVKIFLHCMAAAEKSGRRTHITSPSHPCGEN